MNVHAALCAILEQQIFQDLRPYVDPMRPVALLDFPNHGNVGDSAIWLGELAYFTAAHHKRPAYVCAARDDFDANVLERAAPDATIFLHGGGNFGDIWPEHHQFRESILARFPGRLVVQLPQTIHFNEVNAFRRTQQSIETHGNFVLIVRDQRSFEIAAESFACPVHLVPDMAFCMGAIPRPVAARHPLLLLLRGDVESSRGGDRVLNLPRSSILGDWVKDDPAFRCKKRVMREISTFTDATLSAAGAARRREERVHRHASGRVSRGLKRLSSAAFVITDRLHGHILCLLLGIPHIVFDNTYGKLCRFIDTWTRDCSLVQVASSLEHALALWSDSQTGEPGRSDIAY